MTMSLIPWATRMRTYRKLLVEFWVQSVLTLLKDLIHFLFCVVIEQFSQFHKQGSTSCQELGNKMTGLAHLGDWRGMRAHTSWLERNCSERLGNRSARYYYSCNGRGIWRRNFQKHWWCRFWRTRRNYTYNTCGIFSYSNQVRYRQYRHIWQKQSRY